MTYTEHHQFAQIEMTCDEIRQENAELRSALALLRHDMQAVLRLNSLGKTKEIADLINLTFK
jgi:hypothetical protein